MNVVWKTFHFDPKDGANLALEAAKIMQFAIVDI